MHSFFNQDVLLIMGDWDHCVKCSPAHPGDSQWGVQPNFSCFNNARSITQVVTFFWVGSVDTCYTCNIKTEEGL